MVYHLDKNTECDQLLNDTNTIFDVLFDLGNRELVVCSFIMILRLTLYELQKSTRNYA